MSYEKRISNVNDFVNNIADLYTDPLRVLMEYIDNSLDSADDLRKKEGTENYSRPIKITVEIHRNSKLKDCHIRILDNCVGMSSSGLKGIVQEIGNSRKKNSSWLNGRFGFGVHAYASCCQIVTFITRKKPRETLFINIDRDSKNVQEEKVVKNDMLSVKTGTLVILSGFKDRATWNQIKPDLLRQMIEEHFEFKLREKNLTIEVAQNGERWECKPFDYEKIEGRTFHRSISHVEREDGRSSLKKRLELNPPIEVCLRVSKEPVGRNVLFFSNGRRICKVVEEKSFMHTSNKKMQLWGHPHLVGYIDVKNVLEPQIDRAGFSIRPWQARSIFEELTKLENEVAESLDAINEATRNESLEDLSKLISSVLADIAKEDNLRFRASSGRGGYTGEMGQSGLGTVIEPQPDLPPSPPGPTPPPIPPGQPTPIIIPDSSGKVPTNTPGEDGQPIPIEPTSAGEQNHPKEHQKPGFDIRFHPVKPPLEDGKPVRSEFAGAEIWIYSEHPEFLIRKGQTKNGKIRLTTELISYIAGEVATHYRDEWYSKRKLQIVETDRKRVMQEMVEFIINFENKMKPFTNKTTDEIGLEL